MLDSVVSEPFFLMEPHTRIIAWCSLFSGIRNSPGHWKYILEEGVSCTMKNVQTHLQCTKLRVGKEPSSISQAWPLNWYTRRSGKAFLAFTFQLAPLVHLVCTIIMKHLNFGLAGTACATHSTDFDAVHGGKRFVLFSVWEYFTHTVTSALHRLQVASLKIRSTRRDTDFIGEAPKDAKWWRNVHILRGDYWCKQVSISSAFTAVEFTHLHQRWDFFCISIWTAHHVEN